MILLDSVSWLMSFFDLLSMWFFLCIQLCLLIVFMCGLDRNVVLMCVSQLGCGVVLLLVIVMMLLFVELSFLFSVVICFGMLIGMRCSGSVLLIVGLVSCLCVVLFFGCVMMIILLGSCCCCCSVSRQCVRLVGC